ncbi:MAG: hypothetical protein KatS3mg090_0462 [Patescibacteria group bacterium]|nr:MAG: hypothetical protein KatS3mg090_0462 [Patescibacteria group bacterium]
MSPDFSIELQHKNNFDLIFGVDEVGRGSLAGPITFGFIAIKKKYIQKNSELTKLGIRDSKKLTAKQRQKIAISAKKYLEKKVIIHISNQTIDRIGISNTYRLVCRKFANIISLKTSNKRILLLTDFFKIKDNYKNLSSLPIKKGDNTSISIALSSIYAKVTRDKLMEFLHLKHSCYDWINNKGYGTKKHLQAIINFGVSNLHRISYLSHLNLGTKTLADLKVNETGPE